MTVVNLTGCDLQDAWGDSYSKPKKKKGSRNATDSCDSSGKKPKNFDDIMNYYHPSIFGVYEKSRYSRTQEPLPDTDGEEREVEDRFVSIGDTSSDSYEIVTKNEKHDPSGSKEHFTGYPKSLLLLQEEREKRYMDLAMYVFSGIALIFIMEQFINLGVALKT